MRDLNVLAQAGELRKDDRLALAGSFADAKSFPSVIEGLRGHARYSVTDGDAHLATAWALIITDRAEEAGSFLRLARRWKSSNAAVAVIEKNLGVATKALPAPKPVTVPTEEPVRAPRARGEAPGTAIAQGPLRTVRATGRPALDR